MLNDITYVSSLAKKRKAEGADIINATIGVLFDDNGQICYSKTFDQMLNCLTYEEKYNYGSVLGPDNLGDILINYLDLKNNFTIPYTGVFTSGGTGSLSNILDLYTKGKTAVIIPNLCWQNYVNMIDWHSADLCQYEMFEENKYSVNNFRKVFNEATKQYKQIIVIVNSPAHNPTGYDLTDNDISKMIEVMNACKESNVVFIYDIAYYEFGKNIDYKVFNKIADNVTLALTYSFSKSYGIYGLRLGATLLLSQSTSIVADFRSHSYKCSRVKWSSPNQMAMSIALKIMQSVELSKQVKTEIMSNRAILERRFNELAKYLANTSVKYYPYNHGFFVTLKTKQPLPILAALIKRDVFATVTDAGIRIAISSVPLDKIASLAESIVFCFKEIEQK